MSWLDPERLAKLRQKQESAFVPALLHRPLAIAFLVPTADVAAITPDRLTTVSILMRVAAAALLWPVELGGWDWGPGLWLAVFLWHFGCVLDAADGALARYRGLSSSFGRFYDKVSDRLITLVMGLALGARAYVDTQNVIYPLLALLYIAVHSSASVAKWTELSIVSDPGEKAVDPLEVAAPRRSAGAWAKFLAKRLWAGFYVSEVDLPLWGSIAVLVGWEPWLLIYLCLTAVPYAMMIIIRRGRRVYALGDERPVRPPVSSRAERLRLLRQKQETTFVPLFLHRPLAIAMLLPTAELPWLTPNRLTTASIVLRVVAAGLLVPWVGTEDFALAMTLTAAALWNIGCIFDAADGALARYRRWVSPFGRFYDKVSDRLLTMLFAAALAYRAYEGTGEVSWVLLATAWLGTMGASSVAKWIQVGTDPALDGRDDHEDFAPERSFGDWVIHLLKWLPSAIFITEVDLPLWGSLAALLGLESWVLGAAAAIGIPYGVIAIARRGAALVRLDRGR